MVVRCKRADGGGLYSGRAAARARRSFTASKGIGPPQHGQAATRLYSAHRELTATRPGLALDALTFPGLFRPPRIGFPRTHRSSRSVSYSMPRGPFSLLCSAIGHPSPCLLARSLDQVSSLRPAYCQREVARQAGRPVGGDHSRNQPKFHPDSVAASARAAVTGGAAIVSSGPSFSSLLPLLPLALGPFFRPFRGGKFTTVLRTQPKPLVLSVPASGNTVLGTAPRYVLSGRSLRFFCFWSWYRSSYFFLLVG